MKQHIFLLAAMAALGVVSGHGDQSIGAESAQVSSAMSFFVSGAESKTANLGGLRGADKICQGLASAVGLGNKTWRAYLSAERDPDNATSPPTRAAASAPALGQMPKAWWSRRILTSCTPAKEMSTCFSTNAANGCPASGRIHQNRTRMTF
jgi:hypothetical protein